MANHTIDKFKYGSDTFVLQDNISGYITEEEAKELGYGILVYDVEDEEEPAPTFEEVEQAYQDYNGKVILKITFTGGSLLLPSSMYISTIIDEESETPVDVYMFGANYFDPTNMWDEKANVQIAWIADGYDWYMSSKPFLDDNDVYDIISSSLKTVNSQSLVGSGDLPTKTINNESIWGSGNISISTPENIYAGVSTTSASEEYKTVTTGSSFPSTGTGLKSLSVTFTYGNTQSTGLYLKVDSLANKPVYYKGQAVSSYNNNIIRWEAGETLNFLYSYSDDVFYFVGKTDTDKAVWYGTSSTSSSTATKAVSTSSDFHPRRGTILAVLFSTANTAATPTLNVNSIGSASIYVGSDTPNSTTNVLKWSANTLIFFMYDDTNYRYLTSVSAGSVIPSRGANTWYGTSSTAADTSAKTSSITNYVLTKGSLVSIVFSTANTVYSSAITLNVNSTGAKTIYWNGAATSGTNPLFWDAGETLTFMYDGTYYRFISSDKPKTPEEIFIAEYGSTTFQELVDAYEAGKTLFCKDTSVPDTEYILPLAFYDTQSVGSEYMQFSGFQDSSSSLNLIIYADDTWDTESSSYSSATNWKNGSNPGAVRMSAASNTATGYYSSAQNIGTIAQRSSQTALGEFNIADTTGTTSTRGDYVVIVGNGTSTNNRSNALTLDWNGNLNVAGTVTDSSGNTLVNDVTVGGTSVVSSGVAVIASPVQIVRW